MPQDTCAPLHLTPLSRSRTSPRSCRGGSGGKCGTRPSGGRQVEPSCATTRRWKLRARQSSASNWLDFRGRSPSFLILSYPPCTCCPLTISVDDVMCFSLPLILPQTIFLSPQVGRCHMPAFLALHFHSPAQIQVNQPPSYWWPTANPFWLSSTF